MMIKAENSSKFRRKISKKPSKFAAEQSSANGGSPTSPHRGGGFGWFPIGLAWYDRNPISFLSAISQNSL